MMASQVLTGTLLFALLFAYACCRTIKSEPEIGVAYGGDHYNAAPSYGSDSGAGSYAPSEGASETGFARPAIQGQSASLVGYSGSGAAASPNPAGFAVSGAGFQQGPQDVDWTIQPLSLLSGDHGHLSSEVASPAYGAGYHGGDLSGYVGNYEQGDAMSEMGGSGYVAPSPMMQEAAVQQYAGNFHSGSDMAGTWGVHPFYDYMFMTGQYPPGTITHSASSYEQGRDNFADVHYQRYYIPQYTVQEISIQVPQSPKVTPVKGKGGF